MRLESDTVPALRRCCHASLSLLPALLFLASILPYVSRFEQDDVDSPIGDTTGEDDLLAVVVRFEEAAGVPSIRNFKTVPDKTETKGTGRCFRKNRIYAISARCGSLGWGSEQSNGSGHRPTPQLLNGTERTVWTHLRCCCVEPDISTRKRGTWWIPYMAHSLPCSANGIVGSGDHGCVLLMSRGRMKIPNLTLDHTQDQIHLMRDMLGCTLQREALIASKD